MARKSRFGRRGLGDSKHAIDEVGPGGRRTGCRLISFKPKRGPRVEVIRCAKNKGSLSRAARKRQVCVGAKGKFVSCRGRNAMPFGPSPRPKKRRR